MPWRTPAPQPPAAARVTLAAWRDPTFRYYRAANLLLRGSLMLFRAGLMPRSAMARVLLWAQGLGARGAALLRRRRSGGRGVFR